MEIKREEIKYIDNDPQKGIIVDWVKVFKYYRDLKCPKNIYNPSKELPITKAEYFVLISTRSTGKTTNLLLIGIILYLMYGIVTAYIRQTERMIEKKNADKLFTTINAFKYIETLTNGEYNSTYYFGRVCRFAHIDENGKIDKKSEPFLQALAISNHEEYKSTLNMPTGDFAIFDEFISTGYAQNEFVDFLDLLKTIFRDRLTCKIIMLANTTDYYNEYLKELLIQDEVLQVKEDAPFEKLTPKGTRIFCHLIGNRNQSRAKVNTLYFGFNNSKIASITGGAWAVDCYPHIIKDKDREFIYKGQYLTFNGRYLNLELCASKDLGLHVLVHRANRLPEKSDTRVYTVNNITKKNEFYKFGCKKIDKIYWALYNANKWYYNNNDEGYTVESYVSRASKL